VLSFRSAPYDTYSSTIVGGGGSTLLSSTNANVSSTNGTTTVEAPKPGFIVAVRALCGGVLVASGAQRKVAT
jgi:hypothetical protein